MDTIILNPAVARLRELIAASGRTQADVAAAAGLKVAHLNQVLTGRRRSPSVATVEAILAALGQPWGALDPPPGKK